MKKRSFLLSLIIISLLLTADLNWGFGLYNNGSLHQAELAEKQPYVKGQIIVKTNYDEIGNLLWFLPLKNAVIIPPGMLLMHKYSYIKGITPLAINGYQVLEIDENCDIEILREQLLCDGLVEDASLNYIASILDITPNDPDLMYQYALSNSGQVYRPESDMQGNPGCDIKALEGWEWSTGGGEIVIAVIDSGVALDHEDLITKVIPGYNFSGDNNNAYDDHGHGTFVSSIAAAETNNSKGMAGVSWYSKIMPVKVMNSAGQGSYANIALGIRYAADQGAHILNLSLGGPNPSFILEDACKYAYEKGCVIIVASGNNGGNVLYPAAYNNYCLAVAATNDEDTRAPFSNFGLQVDVAAPGVFVFGALFSPSDPGTLNNYGWGNGTSFSCPYVAGAAALLLHYKPFLTNDQVMDLIRFTADDVNYATYPGVDGFLGYGRINLKTLLAPYVL